MADDFGSDDDDDAFLKLCTQSQFSFSQEKENPKKGNFKIIKSNVFEKHEFNKKSNVFENHEYNKTVKCF